MRSPKQADKKTLIAVLTSAVMLMGQVDYGSFAMIKRIRALVSGKTVFPAATRTGFRKISRFQERLNPIRDALRTHNVYSEINRLAAVRTFMEIPHLRGVGFHVVAQGVTATTLLRRQSMVASC